MQTVPSLVGTGTAIAAAASGLVFGEPSELSSQSQRFNDYEPQPAHYHTQPLSTRSFSYPTLRPATSSAAASSNRSHSATSRQAASRPPLSRYQRPSSSQITPPKVVSRRQSSIKQGEFAAAEGSRDSFSSSSSWIKRLSARPISQHESQRSSSLFDSSSLTFSHGSAAPILHHSTSVAPLPPNKLVKRASSLQGSEPTDLIRRRSRSHLPTLRRPATSHQRSATLQQTRLEPNQLNYVPRYSFDRPLPPDPTLTALPNEDVRKLRYTSQWVSFFHARTSGVSDRSVPTRRGERASYSRQLSSKRVQVVYREFKEAHLVKPKMVSESLAPASLLPPAEAEDEMNGFPVTGDGWDSSPDSKSSRRTRQSISMTFSSAGEWVSRTQGSLRRTKRGDERRKGNSRHVSDSVLGSCDATEPALDAQNGSSTPPKSLRKHGYSMSSVSPDPQPSGRQRNASSPLPPLSRLSSFHLDSSRTEATEGNSSRVHRPVRSIQPSGGSASSLSGLHTRALRSEEAPSRSDSDAEARGFASGDDEDTDFRSDNMFDSVRTSASGRTRTVETPLDSMYDDSPPNTGGNRKTNRLSIQEMLGQAWDEDSNKIMEEDENTPTPVRSINHLSNNFVIDDVDKDRRFSMDSQDDGLPAGKDFGRLSMDDDFDDDWTRDDDAPFVPLSPPSKWASLNSKGMNPNVRLALSNISGNGAADANYNGSQNERPLSTLFDWSETTTHDRQEADGQSLRPQTAYVKNETDSRVGRSAGRKGLAPTHVRSQSVPAAQDGPEASKSGGSKYGTWAMGTKTISEDWDDDFEFGGGMVGNDVRDSDDHFAVPESIRASQPSVKAHSGQIREFSLLVNDLKRLCRHGRDMDMLEGTYKGLWKEAEGIIALASPDEDDYIKDGNTSTPDKLVAFDATEHKYDEGFTLESLSQLDAAFEGREPIMSKTAVVRERSSPRRRSVFSPEDDIFGGNWPTAVDNVRTSRLSRPKTPENQPLKPNDVLGAVRSVMEVMERRSTSESHEAGTKNGRVHFDTTSLKALVKRAGDLRDVLSEVVRRVDQIMSSPMRTPRHERHQDSSPAFTRVFDEPGSSPPRRNNRSLRN